MADMLTDDDKTVEGVAKRLIALLQEDGINAAPGPYRGFVLAIDSDNKHKAVRIEVDCCRTSWGSQRSSFAEKITVSASLDARNRFKAVSYPVEKGRFNSTKIIERVKKGLERIKEACKEDEEKTKEYLSTKKLEKQELKNLGDTVAKSGAHIVRQHGDPASYDVVWQGNVDLDKLPALLQALANARS